VFRDKFIAKYPDAVQKFSGLLMDAGPFIAKEPEQSAEIGIGFLYPEKKIGLKKKLLKTVLTDPMGISTDNLFPDIAQLEKMQLYMSTKMDIGTIVDINSFVDLRFAEQALREDPSRCTNTDEVGEQRAIDKASETDLVPMNKFDTSEEIVTREGKYLTFGLAEERYGINILDIR